MKLPPSIKLKRCIEFFVFAMQRKSLLGEKLIEVILELVKTPLWHILIISSFYIFIITICFPEFITTARNYPF